MKVTFKKLITISCALCFSFTAFSEPPNLSLIKKEIQQYHDSGAYEKEIAQVYTEAYQCLLQQVKENNQRKLKKKLAVVMDIDETSLSNYEHLAKLDFTTNQKQIRKAILAADAPAIKSALLFYRDALKLGVSVFFVTGRPNSLLEVTAANLQHAGYKNWSGIYLRPTDYNQSSIVSFKAETRALISKKGYTIVETIGDQYSDLLGGYAKKEFKLPNPFYFIP